MVARDLVNGWLERSERRDEPKAKVSRGRRTTLKVMNY